MFAPVIAGKRVVPILSPVEKAAFVEFVQRTGMGAVYNVSTFLTKTEELEDYLLISTFVALPIVERLTRPGLRGAQWKNWRSLADACGGVGMIARS